MQSSAVVYRKQAETPDAIERLSMEASILKAVAHPNVVEVLGIHITADKASLRLAEVDAQSVGDVSLNARDFGATIMSAAATLAYIHDAGVAHGAINDIHVLVRKNDRTAVLCGFGEATFTTDEAIQSRDVVALAELLSAQLNQQRDPLRSIINGHVEPNAEFIRSLQSVADVAATGEMSASALAEALRTAIDESSTDQVPAQPTAHPFNKRRAMKIAAAVILPLTFIIAGVLATSHGSNKVSAAAAPTVNTYCKQVDASAIAVDTDNDGCPNAVTIANGVVTVDDQRYSVGNPDDKAVIGDWAGTGVSTLALLEPTTGNVYVFDSWPTAGQTASPRLVATVSGANAITKVSKGNREVLNVTNALGINTVNPEPIK